MNDSAITTNSQKSRQRKRRLQFGLFGLLLLTTILPAPALAWVQVLRESWTQWRTVRELERRCGDSIKLEVVWAREPKNEWTALLGQRRVVEISLAGHPSEPIQSSRLSKEISELVGQLPYLETLVLERVHIKFEGMRALGNAKSIGWLKAHECEFEDGEFPTVGALHNLRSVDFTGSSVGDETIQLLVELPRLRSIDLRRGHVSQENIDLLRRSDHFSFVATPTGIFSSGTVWREERMELLSRK